MPLLQPRRDLAALRLTGWRRVARAAAVGALVVVAALTAVAFVFEQHRTALEPWHGFLAETHGLPLLALAPVVLFGAWAWRGGFPRGLVAGVIAAPVSLVLLIGYAAAHLLSDVTTTWVGSAALLGTAAVFLLASALLVLDWLLPVLERRRLEEADPVFPAARVVSDR